MEHGTVNRGNQPTPTDNLRRGRGALTWGHPRSAGGSTGGAGDRDRTGMASLEEPSEPSTFVRQGTSSQVSAVWAPRASTEILHFPAT